MRVGLFSRASIFKGNKRVYVLGLEPAKWLVYLYGLVVCTGYFWASVKLMLSCLLVSTVIVS